MARLLSVNVGLPREIAWKGGTVRTAIWKQPVHGRVRAARLNLSYLFAEAHPFKIYTNAMPDGSRPLPVFGHPEVNFKTGRDH
jgi:hypothetical protein